ncbi:hypothetical protein IGI04_040941, partial [Brassica rapa subsp. trilocularis]
FESTRWVGEIFFCFLPILVHCLPIFIILVVVIIILTFFYILVCSETYIGPWFFFMQEFFRDFIIFMVAIMSGTYAQVHFHQETQLSHNSSHGHSGIPNRGGIYGVGNLGLNLGANSGSGLSVQGQNRMLGGHPQGVLTHEKSQCPLLKKGSHLAKNPSALPASTSKPNEKPLIEAPPALQMLEGPPGFPPLFPELSKEDRCSALMYVAHSDTTERMARIERVNHHIEDLRSKKDDALPLFSTDLLKEKGMVFKYDNTGDKLRSISTRCVSQSRSAPVSIKSQELAPDESEQSSSSHLVTEISTGFHMGSSSKSPVSGSLSSQKKPRNRPPAWKRRLRKLSTASQTPSSDQDARGIEEAIARAWTGAELSGDVSLLDRIARCRTELSKLKRWNRNLVLQTFTDEDAARVLVLKPKISQEDDYRWGFTEHGAYSTQKLWRQAQNIVPDSEEVMVNNKWRKPPQGSFKCNIGSSWSNSFNPSGVSWILRDYKGLTTLHSRRAYSGLRSKEEADLHSTLWAVESMRDLRQHHVAFESSSTELRQILLNPHHFNHFHHLVSAIMYNLQAIEGWSIHHTSLECNSAAGAIAASVTTGRRYQSYVASNGPAWLHTLLTAEAAS